MFADNSTIWRTWPPGRFLQSFSTHCTPGQKQGKTERYTWLPEMLQLLAGYKSACLQKASLAPLRCIDISRGGGGARVRLAGKPAAGAPHRQVDVPKAQGQQLRKAVEQQRQQRPHWRVPGARAMARRVCAQHSRHACLHAGFCCVNLLTVFAWSRAVLGSCLPAAVASKLSGKLQVLAASLEAEQAALHP